MLYEISERTQIMRRIVLLCMALLMICTGCVPSSQINSVVYGMYGLVYAYEQAYVVVELAIKQEFTVKQRVINTDSLTPWICDMETDEEPGLFYTAKPLEVKEGYEFCEFAFSVPIQLKDIEEIRKKEIPIRMEFTDEWFQNYEIELPYSCDLIIIPPDNSTILYSISKEQIFKMR